jgi:hypothetical protein
MLFSMLKILMLCRMHKLKLFRMDKILLLCRM